MATLIILIISWMVLALGAFAFKNTFLKENAGVFAMSILMFFTVTFHFIYIKGMVMMLPDFLPYKLEIVYATGVLEILAGIGLLYFKTRRLTAILLILYLILIFPSNILAAMHQVKISTGTYDGPGPESLYFRAPLQLLFIAWTWYFCIRKGVSKF